MTDYRVRATIVTVALMFGVMACDAEQYSRTSMNDFAQDRRAAPINIKIKLRDKVVTGSLEQGPAARDFAALLPITLTLEDYASTEKIADLPVKLSSRDADKGHAPKAGDIAYYAPWGNLAIFHKDFRHSPGLILLGRIDFGTELFAEEGPVKAVIERVEAPPGNPSPTAP